MAKGKAGKRKYVLVKVVYRTWWRGGSGTKLVRSETVLERRRVSDMMRRRRREERGK